MINPVHGVERRLATKFHVGGVVRGWCFAAEACAAGVFAALVQEMEFPGDCVAREEGEVAFCEEAAEEGEEGWETDAEDGDGGFGAEPVECGY